MATKTKKGATVTKKATTTVKKAVDTHTQTSGREIEQINKWVNRLSVAKTNQEKVFLNARKNYDIYYALTPEEEKPEAKWKSNAFLPILPGKARDAKAKLSIIDPKFRATPIDSFKLNPETGELNFDQDALLAALKISKKLNKEYSNYTGGGDLPPQVAVDYCNTDAIVAGWGLALAPVEVYNKTYKTHDPLIDSQGNPSAYVDQQKVTTTKILRIGTALEPLDIFKVFISPKAKSFEKSRWLMLEREETYSDLEAANSKTGEYVYSLPADLKDAKSTASTNKYSAVRDRAFGYQTDGNDKIDDSVNLFTVYDCYDMDTNEFFTFVVAKTTTSHKDWTMIRDMKNPYNHGLIPIVPFYVKRRPNSPWGESFFDISRDLNLAYNASFNEFRDSARLANETMALIDVNSQIADESYEVSPGNTIKYDSLNGEKPEPWRLQDPNPNTFGTTMEYLEKNIEQGTMAQYNSGQVDSKMDKTAGTRGGISMMLEMANDRLSEMYRNLKISLLRYGYISLSNAQQFQNYIEILDSPMMNARVSRAVKNGDQIGADYLTPAELQRAYDVMIDEESMLPMTKTERRQVFQEFIMSLIELQKASTTQGTTFNTPEDIMRLDYDDITKAIGEYYAELDAPAFLKPSWTTEELAQRKVQDAAVQQHASDIASKIAQSNNPGSDVSQENGQIQVQRQKREMFTVDKMPADVQNAIIQSYGYPPSQLLNEEARAQIAEFQSKQIDKQVKEQMVAAASRGQLDPATLAKFIKK